MPVSAAAHAQTAAIKDELRIVAIPSGTLNEITRFIVGPAHFSGYLGGQRFECVPRIGAQQPERFLTKLARLRLEISPAKEHGARRQAVAERTIVCRGQRQCSAAVIIAE